MRSNVRWIAVAGVAVAAIVVSGVAFWGGTSPAPTPSAKKVDRVANGSVTAKGTVQPVASRSLSFAISGTVSELRVKPGDSVATGQVLARLDTADAQEAVTNAQTALTEATDSLTEAKAAAAATCAPTPSARPSSSASPRATTSATAAPAATAVTAVTVATAATCGTSGTKGGGADAIFTAQQQVNNATAALSRAKRNLTGTTITAPVTGKVLTVTIKVGDTAKSNVITLGVVSTMLVKASFSESDVVAVSVGQTASVTLPGTGSKTYAAKVSQVAQVGTVTNRLVTYEVLIAFDVVPDGLLVGQSANVTVPA